MKTMIKCVGDRIYPDTLDKWAPFRICDYGLEVEFVPRRTYWLRVIWDAISHIIPALRSRVKRLTQFRKEFTDDFNEKKDIKGWMIIEKWGRIELYCVQKERLK